MRVKVLVIPVYRRHWVYHAWVEQPKDAAFEALLAQPWWRAPGSLQDKLNVLTVQMNGKVNRFVADQWAANAAAKEGSFRYWMHRLALTVMSREDPLETFLKQLPRSQAVQREGDLFSLEVIFPASLDAKLVRRRLWRVAVRRSNTHKRALVGWTLASVPQLPLMVTPLPNVTLYYSLYRAVSHYQAWGGAATLQAAFDNPASHVLQRALDALLEEEGGGAPGRGKKGGHQGGRAQGKGRGGSSTQPRLGALDADHRLEVLLQRLGVHQGVRPSQGRHPSKGSSPTSSSSTPSHPVPKPASSRRERHQLLRAGLPTVLLLRSQALDEAVQPMDRWRTPLDDSALPSLGKVAWMGDASTVPPAQQQLAPEQMHTLGEHVARARTRAVEAEAKRDAARGRTPPQPSAPASPLSPSSAAPSTASAGAPAGQASRAAVAAATASISSSVAMAAATRLPTGSSGSSSPAHAPRPASSPSSSSSWASSIAVMLGGAGATPALPTAGEGARGPTLPTTARELHQATAAPAAGPGGAPQLRAHLVLQGLQARVHEAQLALRRSVALGGGPGRVGAAGGAGTSLGGGGQHVALACLAAGAWAMLAAAPHAPPSTGPQGRLHGAPSWVGGWWCAPRAAGGGRPRLVAGGEAAAAADPEPMW